MRNVAVWFRRKSALFRGRRRKPWRRERDGGKPTESTVIGRGREGGRMCDSGPSGRATAQVPRRPVHTECPISVLYRRVFTSPDVGVPYTVYRIPHTVYRAGSPRVAGCIAPAARATDPVIAQVAEPRVAMKRQSTSALSTRVLSVCYPSGRGPSHRRPAPVTLL